MKLSLFDLHCDTAHELYAKQSELFENDLAVSLRKARKFQRYIQVMALWCPPELTNEEGWNHILTLFHYLTTDAAVVNRQVLLSPSSLSDTTSKPIFLFSLEDARVLNGRIERLRDLYRLGVRILTPLWRGNTCIGGAYDTTNGLTDFGKEVVRTAVQTGMIPDISHASQRSAEELFEIANEFHRPVIASHSNAAAVCPVPRNLNDIQIRKILLSDGVIGCNLCTHFLSAKGSVTIDDILRHIDAFFVRGAADALCLGCDMDGAPLPPAFGTLSLLPNLAEEMLKRNYSEQQIHAIFFENAYRFTQKYIHP